MLRAFVYRAARRAYAWARGDLANAPETNGEYWLIENFIKLTNGPFVAFDIGANRGDWTATLLAASQKKGLQSTLLCFEPSNFTHEIVARRFSGHANVKLFKLAFSDAQGSAVFYENGNGSGSNSLCSAFGQPASTVELQTIDAFLTAQAISHIHLVKVDVEGFDARVIAGARATLAQGRIDALQFEYSWSWAVTGATLRSVFELVEGLPYRVGKLAGTKLLMFDRWHMEMERFFESNYVLVREGSVFETLGTPAYYDKRNVLIY